MSKEIVPAGRPGGNIPKARGAGEKEPVSVKRQIAVLRRLWAYMGRFKWLLILAGLLTVAANLLALLGPQLSGYAINAIEGGPGNVAFNKVFFYCGLMITFYVVSSALSYVLSYIMIKLGKNIAFEMRKDVFRHLLSLPVGFFDKNQAGDIINRLSYDIDTINASLSTDFIQIFTSIITVAGSLIMMLRIKPELVIVFGVTIPTSLIFTRYMTTKVKPLFRKRSAMLGELNGFIEEALSGHKSVKAYCRESAMQDRFDSRNDAAVDAYYNADYYGSIVGPSVNFINNLSLSLISMLGAALYLLNRISLGDISAFVLYSRKFSGPINEMANILNELQSATAAAERVFRMLDEQPEPADIADAVIADSAIDGGLGGEAAFENVTFGYEPEKIVLKNLSFTAESGKTVAIVGPTGAGKTTVISLLMRFYDPTEGAISLSGTDIRSMARKSLRSAFTMVLQDTWLFEGTIADNIAYGREGATREEIEAVARAAHIDTFIESLPEGYDTLITDDGINISKGQKQLLTIARAMLSRSGMLILDEATSNVDSRTEQRIQSAMRSLMGGRTCFVIAHRLSTIENADMILVMRGGEIVERGSHSQLMAREGYYHSLYNAQFDA